MLRILKNPAAENDLNEIWWFIAQDNPDNADKLLDEIAETSSKLAQFKNTKIWEEIGMNSIKVCEVSRSADISFSICRLVVVLRS